MHQKPLAHERDHHIKLLLDYTDDVCTYWYKSGIANVGFKSRKKSAVIEITVKPALVDTLK